MNSEELKHLQAPLKEKYRQDPQSAIITLKAQGNVGEIFPVKWKRAGFLWKQGYYHYVTSFSFDLDKE